MAKTYRFAMLRAEGAETELNAMHIIGLINSIAEEENIAVTDEQHEALCESARQLIQQLERLQREGRNGIWYFILSNSYRPGITSQQFDCIVSNPPWMAMSKLSENPYRHALHQLAEKYGIKPTGASHPHMEMATIFLVSAIDRYLKNNGYWSCIMPGSLLSGMNHEHLRREKYRNSKIRLSFYQEERLQLLRRAPFMVVYMKMQLPILNAIILSINKAREVLGQTEGLMQR